MNEKKLRIALVFCILTAFVGLTGCETMKAKPSEGVGFVQLDQMANRPDLPFNKVWVKEGVDFKQYKMIYIKDVNTEYLMQANWWQKNFRREDMEKDVRTLSLFMQREFRDAFRNDPNKRFEVVYTPQPGALTVELALTELVPSNPVLEAVSLAAPYGSGVAVQVAARESGAKATIAFEARICDSATGEILAMAADREQGKVAPVNLRALTWYGEANVIIDEWADQFVQVANRHPGEVIKPASTFTLKPW